MQDDRFELHCWFCPTPSVGRHELQRWITRRDERLLREVKGEADEQEVASIVALDSGRRSQRILKTQLSGVHLVIDSFKNGFEPSQ